MKHPGITIKIEADLSSWRRLGIAADVIEEAHRVVDSAGLGDWSEALDCVKDLANDKVDRSRESRRSLLVDMAAYALAAVEMHDREFRA